MTRSKKMLRVQYHIFKIENTTQEYRRNVMRHAIKQNDQQVIDDFALSPQALFALEKEL